MLKNANVPRCRDAAKFENAKKIHKVCDEIAKSSGNISFFGAKSKIKIP